MRTPLIPILLCVCLLLLTTCSQQKPIPYPLQNPALAAFQHQIDFSAFKDTIINRHPSVELNMADNGLFLYTNGIGRDTELWMNDSLIIVHLHTVSSLPFSSIGEQVLFEAQTRQNNAKLVTSLNSL